MPVKFEGVKMTIGGEEYEIPPLNLFRIKKLFPVIEKMGAIRPGEVPPPDTFDGIAEVIHSALSRNYPEITKEKVEEIVDLRNMKPIIDAIMAVSGFVQGEKQAGSGQIGIKSTPT